MGITATIQTPETPAHGFQYFTEEVQAFDCSFLGNQFPSVQDQQRLEFVPAWQLLRSLR